MQKKIVVLLITVIFLIIPFLWLKPGEMDIGGDSSRLYFYDPVSYLKSASLFSISASSFGLENIYYFSLPFIALLAIFRFFLSPFLLISIFHGVTLSASFLFTFLSAKEILTGEKRNKLNDIFLISLFCGIAYAFFPALIDGWEHVLLSRNQIFLNPLVFYLFVRYFKTSRFLYLLIIIIISFFFSPNFSIVSAPAIVAFYPISFLFLIIYAKVILRKKIKIKPLLVGLVLFLGVHIFHYFPQILDIFTSGSVVNKTIFSSEGKFNRGLSYFVAIAPNIKLSKNLLGLPQWVEIKYYHDLLIIYPIIILISFFFNKGRLLLILSFIFLVLLFFSSANITNLGFKFYSELFSIPGFSMFRNFYAQWQYSLAFYYALVLGASLALIRRRITSSEKSIFLKKGFDLFVLVLIIYLFLLSTPFIKGEIINRPLWQSKNIRSVMKMDPKYERFIAKIRKLSIDGKIVTLPFTDPAYQVIRGVNDGVYMGPSTIAYLTGKKDFAGYEDFLSYKDVFIKLVVNKEYEDIKNLFSILNIRYLVFNSDKYIYSNFPNFPFAYINDFFPNAQTYKSLISKLNAKLLFKNGDYSVFSLNKENYLPHFYISSKTISSLDPVLDWEVISPFYSFSNDRIAIDSSTNKDISVSQLSKVDIYSRIIKDYPISVNYPFAKWKLNSIFYPVVFYKEKYYLNKIKSDTDSYIDYLLFYSAKRISELERWEGEIPVQRNISSNQELINFWTDPKTINGLGGRKFNSWEASLSRYSRGVSAAIESIEKSEKDLGWKIQKKDKIRQFLLNSKIKVMIVIQKSMKSSHDRAYLSKIFEKLNSYYLKKTITKEYDPSILEYISKNGGKAKLFVRDEGKFDISRIKLVYNGSNIYSNNPQKVKGMVDLGDLNLESDKYIQLIIDSEDVITDDILFTPKSDDEIIGDTNLAIKSLNIKKRNIIKGLKYINGFKNNSYYLISFEYQSYGKVFDVGMYSQKRQDKNKLADPKFHYIFNEKRISKDWTKFNIVLSLKDYKNALLVMSSEDEKAQPIFRNFYAKVLPYHPDIVVKKKSDYKLFSKTPKITFVKINPTKYKIKVEGVDSEYLLIFSDAFSEKWKIYIDPKKKVRGKVVESYYNGKIKQEKSNDSLLDQNMFETLGRDSLLEKNHFVANGYSNGWLIPKGFADGKKSYNLIIEFETQKVFYITVVVSLISLLATVILLILTLCKKYEIK